LRPGPRSGADLPGRLQSCEQRVQRSSLDALQAGLVEAFCDRVTMAHLFVQRRQDAQIQDAAKPLPPSITHST